MNTRIVSNIFHVARCGAGFPIKTTGINPDEPQHPPLAAHKVNGVISPARDSIGRTCSPFFTNSIRSSLQFIVCDHISARGFCNGAQGANNAPLRQPLASIRWYFDKLGILIMKFELKAIKWSEALSQETNAFTANVYINGKNVGYARNEGFGGCTGVHINKEAAPTKQQVLLLLDQLDPNPQEYVKNEKTGKVELQPVKERSAYLSTIDTVVDILVENFIRLKQIKKIQSRVSAQMKKNEPGSWVVYSKVTPKTLSKELHAKISSDPDFIRFLYDLPVEEIAKYLRYESIPTTSVSI